MSHLTWIFAVCQFSYMFAVSSTKENSILKISANNADIGQSAGDLQCSFKNFCLNKLGFYNN